MEGKGEGWQEQGQLEGGRQAGQARQIRPPQQQCQEILKSCFSINQPSKGFNNFLFGFDLAE